MNTMERDKLILPVRTRAQYRAYLLQQNVQANPVAAGTSMQSLNRENETQLESVLISAHNGSIANTQDIGNMQSTSNDALLTLANRSQATFNSSFDAPLHYFPTNPPESSLRPHLTGPTLTSPARFPPTHPQISTTEPIVHAQSNAEAATKVPDMEAFKCTICLEICLQNEPTTTTCGHVFCGMCVHVLISLNQNNPSCPNCKANIVTSSLLRIYP